MFRDKIKQLNDAWKFIILLIVAGAVLITFGLISQPPPTRTTTESTATINAYLKALDGDEKKFKTVTVETFNPEVKGEYSANEGLKSRKTTTWFIDPRVEVEGEK